MHPDPSTIERLLTVALDDIRSGGSLQQKKLRLEQYRKRFGDSFADELQRRWDRRMSV